MDVTTISSIKKEIRELKKQQETILASSDKKDRLQLKRIRKKVKKLKRLTRALAHKARPKGTQPAPAPEAAPATG